MNRIKFIEYAAPIVKKQGKLILPSLILSQIIIEGFNGESLSTLGDAPNYNLFGIKGEGTNGHVQILTHEIINGKSVPTYANFRKYHNWEESIKDHYDLLTKSSRYKALIGERDIVKAATKIWAAGYCTNPKYPELIQNVVKSYSLQRFDK